MRHKILVIDDEPGNTDAFISAFADLYDIASANTVDDGIRLIGETNPELIVLDWRFKAAREGKDVLLYSKRHYPQIPVYVLTASFHFVKEIEACGADACMLKPCDDLEERIAAAFSKSATVK